VGLAGEDEHSMANLFLLPDGLAMHAWGTPGSWIATSKTAADYPALIVATLGNLRSSRAEGSLQSRLSKSRSGNFDWSCCLIAQRAAYEVAIVSRVDRDRALLRAQDEALACSCAACSARNVEPSRPTANARSVPP
jgi:hypothetical protein